MCLQFGFVIFWQKDFGAKAAHKILAKLTPGINHFSNQFSFQTVAHEIGHNLGMNHDFNGDSTKPRFDSKKNPCSGIGGVMDYYGNVSRWSTCSVEDITSYVDSMPVFCLQPVA
jgi:hypothetical protein